MGSLTLQSLRGFGGFWRRAGQDIVNVALEFQSLRGFGGGFLAPGPARSIAGHCLFQSLRGFGGFWRIPWNLRAVDGAGVSIPERVWGVLALAGSGKLLVPLYFNNYLSVEASSSLNQHSTTPSHFAPASAIAPALPHAG